MIIFKRNNMYHMSILKFHGNIFLSEYECCTWEGEICVISTVVSNYHYCMDPDIQEGKCALK